MTKMEMDLYTGESITYSFAVSNLGNTLSNVTVTDALPGLILSGNSIPLLPVGATNNIKECID
jgi:uncharacterized repeat protein (TIGR01451 family)